MLQFMKKDLYFIEEIGQKKVKQVVLNKICYIRCSKSYYYLMYYYEKHQQTKYA